MGGYVFHLLSYKIHAKTSFLYCHSAESRLHIIIYMEAPEKFRKGLQKIEKALQIFQKGTKKGIPLYPNLVNLKSNTMKNTMQRYGFVLLLQEKGRKKSVYSQKIHF